MRNMKRKMLWIAGGIVGVIALLLGLSLFEGGSSSGPLDGKGMVAPGGVGGAFSRDGAAPLPAPAPMAPSLESGGKAMPPQMRAAAPAATGDAGASGGWAAFQFDQKIIRNAVLTIVAKDVSRAVDAVSDIVAANPGAFIASTSIRQKDDRTEATIVIKVPAADFDQTMRRVRQIGDKVTSENTSTQDVTEEFIDLESQVRNLKASLERYLQLLAKATSVQDILSIQERINSVQAQIERAEGRLRFLQQRTSLSTITLNLTPVASSIPGKPGVPWDPARTVSVALANLLLATRGLIDAAIYLTIYSLPLLPVAALAFWLMRRRGSGALAPQNQK
ncbi:MAG: DUF4349 domain-containing protein [Chloroflexi bacterium]|nr:DUF4349 domain-containing protein [Chloroflexota bacterium]